MKNGDRRFVALLPVPAEPLTAQNVRRLDIHDIYERVPAAPEGELEILNAEIRRRLG